MKIQVTVKSVYGNQMVYPVCARAKALANLAGTITLSHQALCSIEQLGFEIENVAQPLSFKRKVN